MQNNTGQSKSYLIFKKNSLMGNVKQITKANTKTIHYKKKYVYLLT